MISQETRMFPFGEVRPGSRIVIYGAGSVGHDYYLQIKSTGYCHLLFMVDQNFSRMGNCLLDVEICSPQILTETDYDYVVVAVQMNRTETVILDTLGKIGVPSEKIICNNRAIIDGGSFWDRDDPRLIEETEADSYWVRTSGYGRTGCVAQQAWNMPAPAVHPGENFYFDISRARKLHSGVRGIAIIFFCGIDDYLCGTPAFEALKKKFPDLDLYGFVSRNATAGNAPGIRDLLEANPHFEKTFYYDGKPFPGCWKNYDYSDALRDIPDDFLVIPYIFKRSPDSEHRLVEIFEMFCLERPVSTPRPILYHSGEINQSATAIIEKVASLESGSRGICVVQFECDVHGYKYSYVTELIEKLLVENYVVVTAICGEAVFHPNLINLDSSVFSIADSFEIFRLIAKASLDMYFIGCNSMSWALTAALGVPNLSVQHWRDENAFAQWFPNITVLTPTSFSRIPAFSQYVDKRSTVLNDTFRGGENVEYIEYHPNIVWEHFQRLLGYTEPVKKKIVMLPEYAFQCAEETGGLKNQRELLAPLGISDYFDYLKTKGRYVHASYGIWYDEYGKMIDAALELGEKDVLDVGCAAGAMVYAFSKQDANAYGCDINCDAVLSSPFPVRDNLYVVETSKLSTAFAKNTFDIIHSQQVLEHFPNKEYSREVVKSMHYISKEDAILFLAFIMGEHQTREELLALPDVDITHINIWPREWWRQEFDRAGFIDVTDMLYPVLACYQFRLSNGNAYSYYDTNRWESFFLVKKTNNILEEIACERLKIVLEKQASFADTTVYSEFLNRGRYCGKNQRKLIKKYL